MFPILVFVLFLEHKEQDRSWRYNKCDLSYVIVLYQVRVIKHSSWINNRTNNEKSEWDTYYHRSISIFNPSFFSNKASLYLLIFKQVHDLNHVHAVLERDGKYHNWPFIHLRNCNHTTQHIWAHARNDKEEISKRMIVNNIFIKSFLLLLIVNYGSNLL